MTGARRRTRQRRRRRRRQFNRDHGPRVGETVDCGECGDDVPAPDASVHRDGSYRCMACDGEGDDE